MSIENNIVDNSKQMMTTFTIKLSKYDNNTLGDLIKYIRPKNKWDQTLVLDLTYINVSSGDKHSVWTSI